MRQAVVGRLESVRQRVERWRQSGGGRGTRIPEELWKDAVAVARVEGVYATSRALRFNYYSLKDRVDQVGSGAQGPKMEGSIGPTFVELEMGELGVGSRTVVELMGQRGSRMRVDVIGQSAVDVVGLAQAFWRSEP